MSYSPLIITSSNKTYSVEFVSQYNELLTELMTIKNPLVVIDRKILEIFPEFGDRFSKLYSMDATEQNKSLAGVEAILEFFQSVDATRSSTVIGIGGGTLGDTVSFAAHIFYRGLNLVLVPTTLLSMCDSCIGGKCGVNFNGYKNQIGAIHPPEKVLIWPEFLNSLSAADLRSGYGEILKYKLLSGDEDYTQFKLKLAQHGMTHLNVLPDIYHGLCVKKKLIEEDEFDVGVRHLLNYGHTFGHALERATENAIPHGVAVARGIDIANFIAWQRGLLSRELFEDVHLLVEKYFSWDFGDAVTGEELISNIKRDKKMVAGSCGEVAGLKMVLLEEIGKLKIESILLDELLTISQTTM